MKEEIEKTAETDSVAAGGSGSTGDLILGMDPGLLTLAPEVEVGLWKASDEDGWVIPVTDYAISKAGGAEPDELRDV